MHTKKYLFLILTNSHEQKQFRSTLYQKYSIMTQTQKSRFSVGQLLSFLDNPRYQTTPKRREPILDRDEIRKQMTLKWKDPGHCNVQFSKSASMRGQILNQWQLERIALAERSYKTPKNSKPYQFDRESREFPEVTLKLYPKKFQRYLKSVEAEKQDLLFREKKISSLSKENKQKNLVFKPISTCTKMFGFGTVTSFASKTKNKHFKTLNI